MFTETQKSLMIDLLREELDRVETGKGGSAQYLNELNVLLELLLKD